MGENQWGQTPLIAERSARTAKAPGNTAPMLAAPPFELIEPQITFGRIGRHMDFVTIGMSSGMAHASRDGGPGLILEVIAAGT